MVMDITLFQPTDVEEKAKFDVFWEVSETARRKVCMSTKFSLDVTNLVSSKQSSAHEGLKKIVLEGYSFFWSKLGSCRNYTERAMKLFQC